jgi:hypothetical protein
MWWPREERAWEGGVGRRKRRGGRKNQRENEQPGSRKCYSNQITKIEDLKLHIINSISPPF